MDLVYFSSHNFNEEALLAGERELNERKISNLQECLENMISNKYGEVAKFSVKQLYDLISKLKDEDKRTTDKKISSTEK
jgi:hypothetical protein